MTAAENQNSAACGASPEPVQTPPPYSREWWRGVIRGEIPHTWTPKQKLLWGLIDYYADGGRVGAKRLLGGVEEVGGGANGFDRFEANPEVYVVIGDVPADRTGIKSIMAEVPVTEPTPKHSPKWWKWALAQKALPTNELSPETLPFAEMFAAGVEVRFWNETGLWVRLPTLAFHNPPERYGVVDYRTTGSVILRGPDEAFPFYEKWKAGKKVAVDTIDRLKNFASGIRFTSMHDDRVRPEHGGAELVRRQTAAAVEACVDKLELEVATEMARLLSKKHGLPRGGLEQLANDVVQAGREAGKKVFTPEPFDAEQTIATKEQQLAAANLGGGSPAIPEGSVDWAAGEAPSRCLPKEQISGEDVHTEFADKLARAIARKHYLSIGSVRRDITEFMSNPANWGAAPEPEAPVTMNMAPVKAKDYGMYTAPTTVEPLEISPEELAEAVISDYRKAGVEVPGSSSGGAQPSSGNVVTVDDLRAQGLLNEGGGNHSPEGHQTVEQRTAEHLRLTLQMMTCPTSIDGVPAGSLMSMAAQLEGICTVTGSSPAELTTRAGHESTPPGVRLAADYLQEGIDGLNNMARVIYCANTAKGWWASPGDDATVPAMARNFAEQLALMHSEVSEALEEYRVHGLDPERLIYFGEKNKPEGIAVELSDVIIRILDTCAAYGIDLERALTVKLAYNATRPHRHGGKHC